jgi:hypothetical protein
MLMMNLSPYPRFLMLLIVLPLLAGVPAHAEDEHEHERSPGTSTHEGGDGTHHTESGDGHNDDGISSGSATALSSSSASSSSSSSGPTTVQSSDGSHRRFGDIVSSLVLDPQQTKAVVAAGKAASMPLLLTYLNQNYPGQVLDVKLHSASDSYVYEVRYLSNVIVLRTLFLDAATLKAK